MSPSLYNRIFLALTVVVVIFGALDAAGVVGDAVGVAFTLVLALMLMAFLGMRGSKVGALLILLLATLQATPGLAPDHATAEFYSAVSQIIPVLLLVLAVEARLFRVPMPDARRSGESWRAVAKRATDDLRPLLAAAVLGATLFTMIAGELRALSALASGHPETYRAEHVYTAVVAGMFVVAFLGLFGGYQSDRKPA